LADYIDKTIKLIPPIALKCSVYNSQTNQVRLIDVIPSQSWGGEGAFGCEFSTGLLSQLPLVDEKTSIGKLEDKDNSQSIRKGISRRVSREELCSVSQNQTLPLEDGPDNFILPQGHSVFTEESTLEVMPELNKSNDDSDIIFMDDHPTKELNPGKGTVSFDLDLGEEKKDSTKS
jgi:hypothetical protein